MKRKSRKHSDADLLAYLDEQLSVERMADVEQTLRKSKALRARVSQLAAERDAGVHSVGDIWRRNRLSCPNRSELGGYVLDTLDTELAEYISFHIETIGCRFCSASVSDLRDSQVSTDDSGRRRQRFFETSVAHLPSRAQQ